MIASNLQVHKDALALMKLIIHYLNTSPLTLRYSLGGTIIKSMASCISEIRIANSNEGARRIEHINLSFGELEDAHRHGHRHTASKKLKRPHSRIYNN